MQRRGGQISATGQEYVVGGSQWCLRSLEHNNNADDDDGEPARWDGSEADSFSTDAQGCPRMIKNVHLKCPSSGE